MPVYIRNPDVDHKDATGCQKCLNVCDFANCTSKQWMAIRIFMVTLLILMIILAILRFTSVI